MNQLRIENFRCFERFEIFFRPRVNLLVGDNATGKTSLLKACKYALSAWFAGFSDENTRWQTFNSNDFYRVEHAGFSSQENPIRIFFDLGLSEWQNFHDVKVPQEQYIGRNTPKNSRSLQSGILELREYTSQLQKHYLDKDGKLLLQKLRLPLFVSFSTEDIHKKRKIRENAYTSYFPKPSFGYYECLNADGLYKYWKKRMLVLKEEDEDSLEVQCVCDAIVKALGRKGCNIISKVHVRPMKKDIYYELVDGRKIPSGLLSDGYRRLVNIVTDIAFRCYLLNGAIKDSNPIEETYGVVLIDEIDMHLHPTLQSMVAKALSDTFPNLQFIISSHAPMVMSSVRTDDMSVVYQLFYDEKELNCSVRTLNTYGLDTSSIMKRYLGVPVRVSEVQERLNQLNTLIDNEDLVSAKQILSEMQAEFGDTLPELVRAESNIRFLE